MWPLVSLNSPALDWAKSFCGLMLKVHAHVVIDGYRKCSTILRNDIYNLVNYRHRTIRIN